MPAQYQKPDDQVVIAQAVEVWGEDEEISPYPDARGMKVPGVSVLATVEPTFVPPYPQAMIPNYTGYTAGNVGITDGAGAIPSSSQVPDQYNLTWVAGDTAYFQFYFDGVCWTPVDPDLDPARPDGISWTMTVWQSQIRAKHYTYYNYWWPPTWPGYRYITSFVVTAEFMEDYGGLGPGTMVSLQGGTIWPGSWQWDLQTKFYPDPALTRYVVRTWMTGAAEVQTQVTQDDLFPPSNWPTLQHP